MTRKSRARKGKASFELTLDEGKLVVQAQPHFRRELSGLLRRISKRAKFIVAPHNRTRKLQRGIKPDKIKGVNQYRIRGSVTAHAPHSKFFHDGTAPHIINARPDNPTGNLRFFWVKQGRWFIGPSVNHPGNKPHPFLTEAAGIEVAAYRARRR